MIRRPTVAAIEVLKGMQQARFRATGTPLPEQSVESMVDAFEKTHLANYTHIPMSRRQQILTDFADTVSSKLMSTPSKFEDPIVYGDVEEIAALVVAASRELGFADVADRVVLGTLDSGQLSATTYYLASSNEYLLTVSLGLWVAARQLASVVTNAAQDVLRVGVRSMESYTASVEARIALNPSIVGHFYRILYFWAIEGRTMPETTSYEAELQAFGVNLHRSLKAFTIAHEYGHILHRHYEVDWEALIAEVPLVGTTMNPYGREQEADTTALSLLRQMEDDPNPQIMACAGASMYFVSTEIMSRVIGILKYGDEDVQELSATHPQGVARWHSLTSQMAEDDRSVLEAVLVEVTLRMLWNKVKPAFLQLHSKQTKVAAAWQSQAPIGGRLDPTELNSFMTRNLGSRGWTRSIPRR